MRLFLVLQKAGQYSECEPGETPRAIFLTNGEHRFLTATDALIKGIVCCKHNIRVADDEGKKIKEEIQEIEDRIEAVRADVEEKAAAMHELDDKVSKVCASNENLLRMAKEAANKDRNLRPKRGHPGYIVTRQDEETMSAGHDVNGNPIYQHGWKVTIETPYDIRIPIELIEKTVKYELAMALRGSVGIYKGRYLDVPEIAREGNVVYNYDFHANENDKRHFWTVCLHSPHQVEIADGKEDA